MVKRTTGTTRKLKSIKLSSSEVLRLTRLRNVPSVLPMANTENTVWNSQVTKLIAQSTEVFQRAVTLHLGMALRFLMRGPLQA